MKITLLNINGKVGLWKYCTSDAFLHTCQDIPILNDNTGIFTKIQTARAFVTLACILSGISMLSLIASAFMGDQVHKRFLWIIKGLCSASIVVGIVSVAIAAASLKHNALSSQISIEYATILAITAVIMNVIGTIVAIFIRK